MDLKTPTRDSADSLRPPTHRSARIDSMCKSCWDESAQNLNWHATIHWLANMIKHAWLRIAMIELGKLRCITLKTTSTNYAQARSKGEATTTKFLVQSLQGQSWPPKQPRRLAWILPPPLQQLSMAKLCFRAPPRRRLRRARRLWR